jgi:hypothetical protein
VSERRNPFDSLRSFRAGSMGWDGLTRAAEDPQIPPLGPFLFRPNDFAAKSRALGRDDRIDAYQGSEPEHAASLIGPS